MSAMKSHLEDFIEALSSAPDLHDEHARARAYMDAKVDLSNLTLEQIRDADQLAKESELSRRISRG